MAENQLDILEGMLKEKGIEYKRIDDPGWTMEGVPVGEYHQIRVKDHDYEWDVICQPGSYGYDERMLEFQDGIEDDVIGNLTAEEVLKIVAFKDYRRGYMDATMKIQQAVKNNRNKGWWKCVFGTGD